MYYNFWHLKILFFPRLSLNSALISLVQVNRGWKFNFWSNFSINTRNMVKVVIIYIIYIKPFKALENHNFLPFCPYSALIRPNSG